MRENIPITVLFADLGKSVVKSFNEFSHEEQVYIFGMIERGVNSSDAILSAAVTTGLLEAMSGQASKAPDLEKRVESQLGEASKKYFTDWSGWHNFR